MSLRCTLLAAILLSAATPGHPSLAQEPAFAPAPPPAPAPSPAANRAEVSFHMERVGLPVPVFTLRIQQDGAGEYSGEEVTIAPNAPPSDPRPFHKPLMLHPATTARIFAAATSLNQFRLTCASSAKNIADTGTKTLTYTAPGTRGECTYNYSENKAVQTLTDTFLAIANTMDIGRKLDFQHRFDRLGLDAETAYLAKALEDGQAAEVLTIASTLQSIAADTDVIQRVRFRAARLLETAKDAR